MMQDWHLPLPFSTPLALAWPRVTELAAGMVQDSNMDSLRSIAHICTVCPLLLQLCSRVLQHGLHCPSELLLCLSAMVDDTSPFIR